MKKVLFPLMLCAVSLFVFSPGTLHADCLTDDDCGGASNGNICVSNTCYPDCYTCNSNCSEVCNRGAYISGSCTADAPPDPVNYGVSCDSDPNSCNETNSGTINCQGVCDASKPADRSVNGNSCSDSSDCCSGNCDNGTCAAPTPSCNAGSAVQSACGAAAGCPDGQLKDTYPSASPAGCQPDSSCRPDASCAVVPVCPIGTAVDGSCGQDGFPHVYKVVSGCDAKGVPNAWTTGSNCGPTWTNGACEGSLGATNCTGTKSYLQTDTCQCPGGPDVIVSQCGGTCVPSSSDKTGPKVCFVTSDALLGSCDTCQKTDCPTTFSTPPGFSIYATDADSGMQLLQSFSPFAGVSNGTGEASLSLGGINLVAGQNTLNVLARDMAGNGTPGQLSVFVGPSLKSLSISPVDVSTGPSGTGTFTASGIGQDNLPATLTSVQWSYSGCTLISEAASGPNRVLVLRAGDFSGQCQVTAAVGTVSAPGALLKWASPALKTLSLTPIALSTGPAGTAVFTVVGQDQSGMTIPVPNTISWTISSSCSKVSQSDNNPLAHTVNVRAGAAGACTIQAAVGSIFSDPSTLTTSTQFVTVTTSPDKVTLAPNQTHTFSAVARGPSGNVITLSEAIAWSVSAPCSIVNSNTVLGPVYVVTVKASSTEGSCTLSPGSLQGNSPTITVSKKMLRITSPNNNGSFSISDTAANAVITGVVSGETQVSIGGDVSGSATVGAPDANGVASWSFNWTQSAGLKAGKKTITATAGSITDSVSFYMFGPPPSPTFTEPSGGQRFYSGSSVTIAASALDNSANIESPTLKPGISRVWFFEGDGGVNPISTNFANGNWSISLQNAAAGTYTYSAQSMNTAAIYGLPPFNTISFRVLQRPTARMISPVDGSQFPLGAAISLVAKVNDPDKIVSSVVLLNKGLFLCSATKNEAGDYTCPMTVQILNDDPTYTITAKVFYFNLQDPAKPLIAMSEPLNFLVIAPPKIVTAARATPNPVTGVFTQLDVDASSVYGAGNLIYRWTASSSAPGPVVFDFNGVAKSPRAFFSKAGSYALGVEIQDALGSVVRSSVTVQVVPTAPILPAGPVYVPLGGSVPFALSTKDQFGNSMTPSGSPLWATTCTASQGVISPSGVFTAGKVLDVSCEVSATVLSNTVKTRITVTNNLPPSVTFTSMTFSDPDRRVALDVTLRAEASDPDGRIQSVQFLVNGSPIGSPLTSAPYVYTWKVLEPGNYYLSVKATDDSGTSITTEPRTLTTQRPKLSITQVSPLTATTGDFQPTGVFAQANGKGFVSPLGQFLGTTVLWNNTPLITGSGGGSVLNGRVYFHIPAQTFLNPGTFSIQLRNPDGELSEKVQFVIDGEPVVRCVDPLNRGVCLSSNGLAAQSLARAGDRVLPVDSSLPKLTRADHVTAVTQFTGGGLRWSLVAGSDPTSSQVLYTSDITSGLMFNLSQLPGSLAPGIYTIRAEGINLAGRVSSPGSATFSYVAATNLSTVRVFPNPWRSNIHAGNPITFDQFPSGSTVKIFTVSGHWVKTLTANGTSVTWDLKNDNGELVQSGLYLFLVNDAQGNKVHGKFAVIR